MQLRIVRELLNGILYIAWHGSGCEPFSNTSPTNPYYNNYRVYLSPIHGQPALVTTEGIGVVAGGSSTSFGWMKEAQVFSDDLSSCSAYVLVHENADLENLKDTLKMLDRICVFTREGELWPEKR